MSKDEKARPKPPRTKPKKKLEPKEDAVDAYVLERLENERDELYERLLRSQAEFDNYRKRMDKEKADSKIGSQSTIFRELLPILDACEKGLETLSEASENPRLLPYYKGYELFLTQLQSLLARFEVAVVPGVGAQFDPNVHEAVLREFTVDHEDGVIVDEFRKGYTIRDRLLRASQVKVAMLPPVEANRNDQ